MHSLEKIISHLSGFVLDGRFRLMREKVSNRTRYLTVCLENIFQPQNASAILRSMEAFGIQDIHLVENLNKYNVNPDITLGTDKWINIVKHNTAEQAISVLKNNGYRIVAAVPEKNAVALEDFDLTRGKAAIFFGTELTGLSGYAIRQADEYLYIPMCGFVESLNVSVSAAVAVYSLTGRLRASGLKWQLEQDETDSILFDWLKKSIHSSDKIIKRYLQENPQCFD